MVKTLLKSKITYYLNLLPNKRLVAKFLQWQRVEIARIAEFTTSNVFIFNDFFHFLGLNWSLNDVKHTILVLQKQLISTKYFLIYTHFAVSGKGLKNAYFHLCTVQNSHIF